MNLGLRNGHPRYVMLNSISNQIQQPNAGTARLLKNKDKYKVYVLPKKLDEGLGASGFASLDEGGQGRNLLPFCIWHTTQSQIKSLQLADFKWNFLEPPGRVELPTY